MGRTRSNLGISFRELIIIWFPFPVQNEGARTQDLKYVVTVGRFHAAAVAEAHWRVRGLGSERRLVNISSEPSCEGDAARSSRLEAAGDIDGL